MNLIKMVELATVNVGALNPHPDALSVPTAEDDRAALNASIDCVGMLEPVMVVKSQEEERYLIIDGVGRWEQMCETEQEIIAVLVVECSNVRSFVAHKNAMGRRRSTGSRVLSYIMANADKIITSDEWSNTHVAQQLKVSREDVNQACHLYCCHRDGFGPDGADNDKAVAVLAKIFNAVLGATLPIRRWKAAYAGAMTGTQPGESGRAQADYNAVLLRGIDNLTSAFKAWPEIKWADPDQQILAQQKLGAALSHCPESMRSVISRAIVERWTTAEKKALIKELKTQGF